MTGIDNNGTLTTGRRGATRALGSGEVANSLGIELGMKDWPGRLLGFHVASHSGRCQRLNQEAAASICR